jgi:hypothetical protein
MRYAMRRSRLWAPFLVPFGGTASASFVEVEPARVRFRFGWGFDRTVARSDIVDAYRTDWPFIAGVGWRLGGGCVGLIGSTSGVVEVVLHEPLQVRLVGLPYRCRRIAVSLEDPDGFLAELRGAGSEPKVSRRGRG